MDRWHAMKVFVKVAEAEGFAEAARQLNLSPPAVTRAIASIEQTIGARLLVRTTRAVKLTEVGARYLLDCRRILADIEEAEAAAAGSYLSPAGSLTVTAPALFGREYVLPVLMDYLREHRAVTGHALFVDRITSLVDEGIDVAIRIGHLPDSSLRAIPVGQVRRVVCAAPAYLREHGIPQRPQDLAGHRVVALTSAYNPRLWRFEGDTAVDVELAPRLICNTVEAALAAATDGWGLVSLLSYQVAPAVAAGQLQTVLESFEGPPLPIHVLHAEGPRAAARVRSFVDFAVARLRANRMIS